MIISETDVPKPPRHATNGVIDDGTHRWRFKASKLIAYMDYGKRGPPGWEKLWVKKGER